MMNLTRLLLVIGLSLTLGACGSDDTVSVADETGGTSSGGGSSSGGDATSQERVLASDLAITDIAAYQSVRVGLVSNGAPVNNPAAPLVGRKDVLVRVFVQPQAGFQARSVTARLELSNSSGTYPLQEASFTVTRASTESNGNSTFNFFVDGEVLDGTGSFRVSLYEAEGVSSQGGDVSQATFPRGAGLGAFGEEPARRLRIVLVPVQYNADGSGRLPDTSEAQIDRYREAFYAMFPASEVDISVRSAIAYNRAVEAYGTGWDTLLNEMAYLRYQDRVADDVYYYGIFNPASSVYNYCSGGCVLGLSNLVQDYRYAQGRVSIGLGFTGDESVNTMVHEVGHAHGREHAPCGLGGQPSDRYYPNNTGKIDDWGFDHRSSDLRSPGTYVDVMSYCSPSWISVYNYDALYTRFENIDRLQRVMVVDDRDIDLPWPILIEQADGSLAWGRPIPQTVLPQDQERRTVEFSDADGEILGATSAYYLRFSHLDGGFLLINPEDIPEGTVKVLTDKATIEY